MLMVISALSQWRPGCKSHVARELFAKNKNRPNGLHAYCLACNRRKQAEERARRGDDYREMRRRYRASEKGRAAYSRYVPKHPWQKWAQMKIWNAIERGLIVKPDVCQECGKGGIIDGHHDDYAKPLQVRWLCRWCHQEWHRINGEAKNANESIVKTGIRLEQQNRRAARLPLVVQMFEAGTPQKEIAALVGVSAPTIHSDLKFLGRI